MEERYEMNIIRLVLTGGPGSGKTSLVNSFNELGYTTFQDAATELILQGEIPPVIDPIEGARFGKKVLDIRIQHFQKAQPGVNIYDRGIPDGIAFANFLGRNSDPDLIQASERFQYTRIYILPPWVEIFSNNSYRKESYAQSERIYHRCLETYCSYYQEVTEVPRSSLNERIAFILDDLDIQRKVQNS